MNRFLKAGVRAVLDAAWRLRIRSSLVSCNLCGSKDLSTREAYGRLFAICGNCGGVQAREIPESIQLIGMGIDGSWGGALQGGEREHFLAHLLADRFGMDSFLLYGSGATRAPLALVREGFAATALDVSVPAVDYLNTSAGKTIAFTQKTLPSGLKFDAVVACEVFEHFNDPKRWFRYIGNLLGEGGIICGTTDFYGGGEIDEGDGRPGYMSLLGHTFYWSLRSMEWLARSAGMKFLSFEMQSPGSVYPDHRFGVLFPNKRIFFFTRDEEVYASLQVLKEQSPILPLDTRSYWDRVGWGDISMLVGGESPDR